MLFHINSLEYAADKASITPRILRKYIKIRRLLMLERKKSKIFKIIFLIPAKAEGVKFYNRYIEQCSTHYHSDNVLTTTLQRKRGR